MNTIYVPRDLVVVYHDLLLIVLQILVETIIHFNYVDKCELDVMRNVSVIIVYRPPNTDSSLFINELERILTMLKSENRDYISNWRFQL